MGELLIRRAGLGDIEAMVRLRRDMQAELNEDGRGLSPDSVMAFNRDYFERQLPKEAFVAFVAASEGEIVATSGMVVYEAPPTPGNPSGVEGYIMNMYTLPKWRSHGLARRLLDCLTEYARGLGARRVWLRASAQGRRVYEPYGFAGDKNQMFLRLDSGG
jgi:GNAT superfamily N-acetyltransferase